MSFENDFNQSDSSLDFSNGRDLYDEDITSQTDYRILLDDLNDINIKENFSEEISPIFKESTTIYKSKTKEFNDDVDQCEEEILKIISHPLIRSIFGTELSKK
ncbi:hypothetical protein SSS_03844 [Sarcoptes scabiei]|nr:hypothetical protein SSS_03844 [Sarcoptes scabiei]